MDHYEFALARPKDAAEVLAVYHSLIGSPGCMWSLAYPTLEIAEQDIERRFLYTLRDNGELIAVASAGVTDELDHLPWKPKKPCDLMRVAVIPSRHKQGIGTYMLHKVISAVREQGYDGMRILVSQTSPMAMAFYEKNGFERCGETYMYEHHWHCCQIQFSPVSQGA